MNYEDRLEGIELRSASMGNQMLVAIALDALSRIRSSQENDGYIQYQSAIIEAILSELKTRMKSPDIPEAIEA